MNLIYRSLIVALTLGVFSPLRAQNGILDTLEQGITEYSKLHSLSEAMIESGVAAVEINAMEKIFVAGKSKLDAVMAANVDSLAPITHYLRQAIQYDFAQVLALSGNKSRAIPLLEDLKQSMSQVAERSFPLVFEGQTKAMTVQWSDFAPQYYQYNVSLGEHYYDQMQYDTALVYIRKAQELNDWDNKQTAPNMDRLVRIKTQRKEYDQELLDATILLMENYGNMDSAERSTYPQLEGTIDRSAETVEQVLTQQPDLSDNGEVWARTYRLLANEEKNEKALDLAQKAFDNNYRDPEFLLSTFHLANTNNRPALAKQVLDAYSAEVKDNECENLGTVANYYTILKEEATAKKYQDKAAKCEKNKAQEIKVAGRDGGLYLGTYVFPWIRTDWGAVAGIQTRKHLFEFSYQSLSDRRDRLYDLRLRGEDGAADQKARWDGYYAHVAASKIKGKKGGRTYNGILLGYNLREFQDMTVTSITDANGNALNDQPVTFKPREQRYIFMLNGGLHSYGRYLAADFYMGYGFSWNQFDRGNDNFDNNDYVYAGNALLNGRKQGRLSLMARVGVTIGFQLGPRTFEPKKGKKKSQS